MRVLEIGPGNVPTIDDGWEHLDVRPLWHVEYVQSAVDLSNFEDGTFDKLVAQDVIEHLSWRDVPKALAEWVRVVASGGMLEVETPNAWELVRIVLNGQHPDLNRVGEESDWEMFCRVAYGHQDYPENTHLSYFTPEWLEDLLLVAGAASVRRMSDGLFRFRLEATK
jgi:ubiquinone/menaquinone biosynthesis C-methylase UbiE